jgi:hypothetical protein
VEKCRERDSLRYALAIIIPESNLPFVSVELQAMMKDQERPEHYLHNHLFMMEDSGGKNASGGRRLDLPGSITTHRNKLESVTLLIDQYFKPEAICFHEPFIISQEEITAVESVQLELVAQLRNFKKQRLLKKDSEGNPISQIIFTGKKTGGRNDDFVSALQILVMMKRTFWRDQRYAFYHGTGEQ